MRKKREPPPSASFFFFPKTYNHFVFLNERQQLEFSKQQAAGLTGVGMGRKKTHVHTNQSTGLAVNVSVYAFPDKKKSKRHKIILPIKL